jgi:hypothetical protein
MERQKNEVEAVNDDKDILKVLEYIQSNYSSKITIEKLMEISDKAASLPDEKKREAYSITKEDVVSRLISVNNSIDAILLDIEESSVAGNMNASMTIIGGGFPMGSPMF